MREQREGKEDDKEEREATTAIIAHAHTTALNRINTQTRRLILEVVIGILAHALAVVLWLSSFFIAAIRQVSGIT